MKKYKFINDAYTFNVEDTINALANQGWTVKSFNVSFKGEDNDDETCFALLEYDDESNDIEYLEGIYERLGDISDKLSNVSQKLHSLGNSQIQDKVDDIKYLLDDIRSNTSN